MLAGQFARFGRVAALALGSVLATGGPGIAQWANGSQFMEGEGTLRAAAALPGRGVLAVGTVQTTGGNTAAIIRGTNAAGDPLFTARVLPPGTVSSLFIGLTRLASGDYVATGWMRSQGVGHDDCLISRIRPSGAIAWTRQIAGAGVQRCYFAVQQGADAILAGGRFEPANDPAKSARGLLVSLRADTGEPIAGSRQEIGAQGTRRSAFRTGLALPDGSFVLGGWATDENRQGDDDAWVTRLASDLRPLWTWRWGETGNSITTSLATTPGGLIIAVGGTGGSDRRPQSFAAAIDMAGRASWRRTMSIGGSATSEFQRVLAASDQTITAFGWASDGPDGPARAVIVPLSPAGQPGQAAMQRNLPDSRAFDAVAAEQGFVVVGSASRPGVARPSAWLWNTSGGSPVPDDPRPPVQASNPGEAGLLHVTGRLAAGQMAHHGFTLARRGPVRVVAVPERGDVDIILRTDRGETLRISDNAGTLAEFIAATLPAGRYDVEVTCNQDAAYRLDVSGEARPAPGQAAVDLEQSWGLDAKGRIQHALELIGYRGVESTGVFGAATRSAIAAFQTDVGHPPSGWLSDGERLALTVKATEAAAQRAEAAAKSAQLAAASRLASAPMARTGGGSFVGQFGGDSVLGVGKDSDAPDQSWYAGEWRRVDDTDSYEPHGFGVMTNLAVQPPLRWVGEFQGWGTLSGFGFSGIADGATIYAGEWVRLGQLGHRRRGYGVQFINFANSTFQSLPAGGMWRLQGVGQQTVSVLDRPIAYPGP